VRSLYRRRQIGWTILLTLGLAALFAAAAGLTTPRWTLFLIVAVMILSGLLFSSLTIEVTESELLWFFGPGFLKRRIARSEIVSAKPAHNRWWWGWGVHLTPRGWLYNVHGRESVEIVKTDGESLRLGADEPQALASALSFRTRDRLAGEACAARRRPSSDPPPLRPARPAPMRCSSRLQRRSP
jgi:hypothetical protein